ncbi:excalibur calcium-binding domain-containing protein [Stenotrophomonas pictorum]|uniref:excalibur calcium-binding domain-containing protein n=1 Tax=Stenotrophomonas pictorum TaxID=86184 RepID=UPI0009FA40E9|nr:excalibur calcium-binding domain-containing protein [Stenotrophomonas pictorum]
MKNLIVLAILAALGWYGYGKYKAISTAEAAIATSPPAAAVAPSNAAPVAARFSCDGRTHCSQMRSCAEATYFVQHCPNTKMDGDNDGVPCEKQWCQ